MAWQRELKVERPTKDVVRVEVVGRGIVDLRRTEETPVCVYKDLDHPAVDFTQGEMAAAQAAAVEEFRKDLREAA